MTTTTTKTSSSSIRAAEAARKQAEAQRAAEKKQKARTEWPVAEVSKPAMAALSGSSGFDAPGTRVGTFNGEKETKVTTKPDTRIAMGSDDAISSKKVEKYESKTTWVDGMDPEKKATLTESVSAEKGFKLTEDSASVSGKVKGKLGFESKSGWGLSAEGEASSSAKVTEKDGKTSFVVSGEISGTVSAAASIGVAGVGGSEKTGASASLSVTMPTEAFKELAKDPSGFNPMDPDTYPEGTTVVMAASEFHESERSGSMKVGGPLEVTGSSSTKETDGNLIKIEKLPDGKVRLTEGPAEAFERTDSYGLKLGEEVEASVARTDELGVVTTKSAEFDLTTEEGRAAFNEALLTSDVPTKSSPGVTNPKQIGVISHESSADLKARLGPLEGKIDLGENTSSRTIVINEDGTSEATTKVEMYGNPELTISEKYDAEGNETSKSYSFEITPDEETAGKYNMLLTGSREGPVKAGETVSLTFTEDQLAELQDRIVDTHNETLGLSSRWVSRGVDYKMEELTTDQLALVIARSSSEHVLADELMTQLVTFPTAAGKPLEPLGASIS